MEILRYRDVNILRYLFFSFILYMSKAYSSKQLGFQQATQRTNAPTTLLLLWYLQSWTTSSLTVSIEWDLQVPQSGFVPQTLDVIRLNSRTLTTLPDWTFSNMSKKYSYGLKLYYLQRVSLSCKMYQPFAPVVRLTIFPFPFLSHYICSSLFSISLY